LDTDKQKQADKQAAAQAIQAEQRTRGITPLWYVSLFISLPFGIAANELCKGRVDDVQKIAIIAVVVVAVTFVAQGLIRRWLSSKPVGSRWRSWLG
jgi:hypothetical protein